MLTFAHLEPLVRRRSADTLESGGRASGSNLAVALFSALRYFIATTFGRARNRFRTSESRRRAHLRPQPASRRAIDNGRGHGGQWCGRLREPSDK